MKPLLHEIEWGEPLVPPQANAELEAEFKKRHKSVPYPECLRRVAGSEWLARSLFPLYDPIHAVHLNAELANVAVFVTCQENSCRYCYGALRTILKIIGFSEKRISELEQEVALADGQTRRVVEFTRKLAESNPRPAQRERDRLKAAGLSDQAIAELVGFVIVTCFANRVATFLAVPPGLSFESLSDSLWVRLFHPFFSREFRPRKAAPFPVPPAVGDFGALVAILGDTWPANWLRDTIDGCFASPLLDRRMKLLLFAAVATAMECGFCQSQALSLLAREGLAEEPAKEMLAALESPRLTPAESLLLDWARETVWYEPRLIQSRTKELTGRLGAALTVEAVGTAALANSAVRLAMLV